MKSSRDRRYDDRYYKHYDLDDEGFGSEESWAEAAEALMAAVFGRLTGIADVKFGSEGSSARRVSKEARALDMDHDPTTLDELSAAFRAAIKKAHPDGGGSTEQARAVIEANRVLKARLERQTG